MWSKVLERSHLQRYNYLKLWIKRETKKKPFTPWLAENNGKKVLFMSCTNIIIIRGIGLGVVVRVGFRRKRTLSCFPFFFCYLLKRREEDKDREKKKILDISRFWCRTCRIPSSTHTISFVWSTICRTYTTKGGTRFMLLAQTRHGLWQGVRVSSVDCGKDDPQLTTSHSCR